MTTLAEPVTSSPEERTEHPHIVRVPGVCGGRPVIRGSRIAVWHVARLFRAGSTPVEIAQEFNHLPLSSIYDAISYYLDHRAEVDNDIANNRVESALTANKAKTDDKGRVIFSA
jgi:uncharacterized protein (DUF433 family)